MLNYNNKMSVISSFLAITQLKHFYPHPLWEHGSTDGHFLLLRLLLHTTNFLFLLGTENTVGGRGSFAVMRSCFLLHIKMPRTYLKWLNLCQLKGN